MTIQVTSRCGKQNSGPNSKPRPLHGPVPAIALNKSKIPEGSESEGSESGRESVTASPADGHLKSVEAVTYMQFQLSGCLDLCQLGLVLLCLSYTRSTACSNQQCSASCKQF